MCFISLNIDLLRVSAVYKMTLVLVQQSKPSYYTQAQQQLKHYLRFQHHSVMVQAPGIFICILTIQSRILRRCVLGIDRVVVDVVFMSERG